jgi:hypothetical protein
MKKAFNFYRSYWEVANELNDSDRLAFYDALLKKQFTNIDTELKGMVKFAYLSQKHSIDKQIDGYISQMNKRHPNQDPWQGATQGTTIDPTQQEKEKEKEKEKVQLKKNNIDERKLKFASTLNPFVDVYGRDMINDFFKYWTEPNKSNTKFKQELEKTWSVERRLETWSKNDFGKRKTEVKANTYAPIKLMTND